MTFDKHKITRVPTANQSPIEAAVALLRETHYLLLLSDFMADPRPLKLRVDTERFLRNYPDGDTPEAA